ncbi:unnamed protein product [Linum tenue]|uniref:Cytochrome P450 n=1 Tax=Linum tenue TaxID=586396 RepID=A0AAV0L8C6_9ROSI|nr:unnamed protein product [Linum tenue]
MIEWAMSELLNSDKAMKSVKRELDKMLGLDSLVKDHHLRNLKYLDAVIKETCRLHLALVTRTANQTCTVGEFTVPQGTEVVVNGWAMRIIDKREDCGMISYFPLQPCGRICTE